MELESHLSTFDTYLDVAHTFSSLNKGDPLKTAKGDLITDGESSETQRVQNQQIYSQMEEVYSSYIKEVEEACSAIDNQNDIHVDVQQDQKKRKEAAAATSVSPVSGGHSLVAAAAGGAS